MELLVKNFPEFVGSRIDKFLSDQLGEFSRSQIQKLIKGAGVLVNGVAVKPNYLLALTDKIWVKKVAKPEKLEAEDLNLDIVHDDKEFFVINKPAGMVVHPAEGRHMSGTVVNAILNKIEIRSGDRPGIVHRLDKDTSGLMIIAKTEQAYEYFVESFKNKKIKKNYLTLVSGHLEHKKGVIEAPIARDDNNRKKMAVTVSGKMAVSAYRVLEEFSVSDFKLSLLEVEIKTGRTHQIRVHMNSIGHFVVGDSVYGGLKVNRFFKEKFGLKRQFLHAKSLKFIPPGKKKALTFESELPNDLAMVLKQL